MLLTFGGAVPFIQGNLQYERIDIHTVEEEEEKEEEDDDEELFNYARGHKEEPFCEIILNLDQ